MNWYLKVVLENYANFSGRARRTEYWMFVLFNFIIIIGLSLVDALIRKIVGFGFLANLYCLAILIPSIAVGIRRLHDTDRSGWWLLVALIPFIGGIILLVFAVLNGTPGSNQYGEDPKQALPPSSPMA